MEKNQILKIPDSKKSMPSAICIAMYMKDGKVSETTKKQTG